MHFSVAVLVVGHTFKGPDAVRACSYTPTPALLRWLLTPMLRNDDSERTRWLGAAHHLVCPPSACVSSSAHPTQSLSSPSDWSACDDTVRTGNTKLSHDHPASLLQHAAHGYVGGPSSGHGKTTVKPNSPAIRIHRPDAPFVAAALHKPTRGARES